MAGEWPPVTDAALAEIEARAHAATEPPWTAVPYRDGEPCPRCGGASHYAALTPVAGIAWEDDEATVLMRREDAQFIAHSREDVPRLVAEVRRLRARQRLEDGQTAQVQLEGALLTARTVQDAVQNQLGQAVSWAELLAEDPALPAHLRDAAVRAAQGAADASRTLRQLTQLSAIKTQEWGPGLEPTIDLADSSE